MPSAHVRTSHFRCSFHLWTMIGSCCLQEGTFSQKSGIQGTLNYHHLNTNIDILYRAQINFSGFIMVRNTLNNHFGCESMRESYCAGSEIRFWTELQHPTTNKFSIWDSMWDVPKVSCDCLVFTFTCHVHSLEMSANTT